MKSRWIILLVLCFTWSQRTHSQVIFNFLPEVYGRNVDGLSMVQIQNLSGGKIDGKVFISVKENKSKSDVMTLMTPVFTLNAGNSNLPRNVFANSSFNFASNALASIVNQTRSFPAGEYTFCFKFVSVDKDSDDESCFDGNVQPLVPLTLLSPDDKDKICQKRPPLSWQPPIPYSPSMKFRLLLTEKKQGDAVENLLTNSPLILLDNISSTMINYPTSAPDLQEGKTYCWQVIAYQNGVTISQSEIWEFTVQCTEPAPAMPKDSYRELQSLVNGNYYIANRYLKFSFTNNYNVKKLNYAIYSTENLKEKIKNTPEVAIQTGLNKIDINLTELDLEVGKHYLLKVMPFNEPAMEVRFIYQDKDSNE
ncbi:DUF928 domain-containing protein [Pinibacter aurantiacus]|uniref:DUF928 domain-containing protein n=1 Tax=Pinibacter aurantiacus TaxID=2851599 RepID=A0A9E2W8R6_9BACT|nr:DUF928 domain-containing protein [Pinibacter aurantiacus]MBV4358906.1 DUF928 domain-containing protein [Pinibacter aurantiacus]